VFACLLMPVLCSSCGTGPAARALEGANEKKDASYRLVRVLRELKSDMAPSSPDETANIDREIADAEAKVAQHEAVVAHLKLEPSRR
jgi:hypothetical protein